MTIEIAKKFCAQKLPIIPVPHMSKSPVLKGWPELQINESNCQVFFSNDPSNIAVLLGKPNSNLVDLDVDNPKALDFAEAFAPKTSFIFGRSEKPKSHYLYRVQEQEVPSAKFQHPEFGCLLEVRGTGSATILPGSTHPSGDIVSFDTEGAPSSVSLSELKKKAALIAVCTAFCLEGIAKGARHTAALGVAALLCKAGVEDSDVVKAVHKIAEVCGDEEAEDRKHAARDTVVKFQQGQAIAGSTILEGVFSPETMKLVRTWLGYSEQAEIADMIDALNQRYAFVLLGGTARIVSLEKFHENTESPFLKVEAFRGFLKKDKVQIGTKANGQPILKSYGDLWIEHTDRRTYAGVVFDPSAGGTSSAFNLWRGFNVQPDATLSCDLFLSHLEQVICGGNQEYFRWFLAWLADIVQNPGEKPGTAIAIRGGQGAGKSSVGEYFGSILGHHYLTVSSPRHAMGNFNAHLADKVLVMLEEAFWAGDKVHEGVLKDMITNNHMLIESKGVDAIKAKNCLRLIATSNNAWIVPAAVDDRRFFVLSASDKHAKDQDYFNKFHEERKQGGPEALLAHLQSLDISGVDLRNAPQTQALVDQKIQSLDMMGRFLHSALTKGSIFPKGNDWPEYVETAHLFRNYRIFAQQAHLPDKGSETSFGMNLRRYFPNIEKVTKTIVLVDEETGHVPNLVFQHKHKRQVYLLPKLEESREIFEKSTGIPILDVPEVEE